MVALRPSQYNLTREISFIEHIHATRNANQTRFMVLFDPVCPNLQQHLREEVIKARSIYDVLMVSSTHRDF